MTVDVVITRIVGDVVYARRVHPELACRFPEIVFARIEELGYRPDIGEVIGIGEGDYENCEVAHGA